MVKNVGRMPVVFVGHGSPMNAIEDNKYSRKWTELGKSLPRPTAILCVSAHWYTSGTFVGGQAKPRTIHDFYGFPKELYRIEYPAPGSPDLAKRVLSLISGIGGEANNDWGLDHGCWSVIRKMYPEADVPIVQLSVNGSKPPSWHFDLAKRLAPLRDEGIMVLGSGNIVHNLGMVRWDGRDYEWAPVFDKFVQERIEARDYKSLMFYDSAPGGSLAVPTNDHYLPILYPLGLRGKDEPVRFFSQDIVLGSVSMTGFISGVP